MSLQANIYYDKILLDLFSIQNFAGRSVVRYEAQLTQKRAETEQLECMSPVWPVAKYAWENLSPLNKTHTVTEVLM